MPIVPKNSSPTDSDAHDQNSEGRPLPSVRRRVRQAPPAELQPEPDEDSPAAASDYVVGYARPPVHTRFKPGTSGNPKGRSKGARGLNTLARELLTERVPVRTASGEKRMHRIEAVLHKTFELALKGNPRALSQILGLYASAVPETAVPEIASPAEELTATDLAILEELKASLLRETGQ